MFLTTAGSLVSRVIVGDKTMDEAAVFRRENVWWLGPKSYDVLPGYLHHFSVATIPFKVNDVTHSVPPKVAPGCRMSSTSIVRSDHMTAMTVSR